MKIMEDIYLVGGGEYGLSPPGDWCNVYLLNCGEGLVLIDSGTGIGVEDIIRNIKKEGFDPLNIKYIFLTHSHFDHIGGAHKIQELTGCKVAIHENGAKSLGTLDDATLVKYSPLKITAPKVDLKLKGGEKISIGRYVIEVIYTPGHTADSICLYIHRHKNKVLFTGDTVFSRGRIGWFNTPGSDLLAYKRSLEYLLKIKPEAILPGHGPFILSRGHEHVKLLYSKLNVPWKHIITVMD
ncbi:MAG: MBL fold metallo-hydrolase [Desulfurococcales archaeon]|nr:MBL fold metallo-hydrolase [Desulfurococcales archaeon]